MFVNSFSAHIDALWSERHSGACAKLLYRTTAAQTSDLVLILFFNSTCALIWITSAPNYAWKANECDKFLAKDHFGWAKPGTCQSFIWIIYSMLMLWTSIDLASPIQSFLITGNNQITKRKHHSLLSHPQNPSRLCANVSLYINRLLGGQNSGLFKFYLGDRRNILGSQHISSPSAKIVFRKQMNTAYKNK